MDVALIIFILYCFVAYAFNITIVKSNTPAFYSEWKKFEFFLCMIVLAPFSFPIILMILFYLWVMEG